MASSPRPSIRRHFTAHPASVGETYGEHARFALSVAAKLATAAAAAAIHAVYPPAFETTASARIRQLNDLVGGTARAESGSMDTTDSAASTSVLDAQDTPA